MRLIEPDNQGSEEEDYGSPEEQELEGMAYRYVQIVPEICIGLFDKAISQGIDHPVIFLCDVADPMGFSIARKFTSERRIQEVIDRTIGMEGKRPGICLWIELESLAGREPSLYGSIRARMEGMVLGYFPIVVVGKGGYSCFPWPIPVKEKSKFNLIQG